jgi:quinol monooxygenase YgiN
MTLPCIASLRARGDRILSRAWFVFAVPMRIGRDAMTTPTAARRLVRYQVKPERVAENEALVRAVFESLRASPIQGLRYAAHKLDDGVSFVHLVEFANQAANEAFVGRPAFKAFVARIGERCDQPPLNMGMQEIGAHGFFEGR